MESRLDICMVQNDHNVCNESSRCTVLHSTVKDAVYISKQNGPSTSQ